MPQNRSQGEQDDFHKRVAGALGGALAGIKEGEKQLKGKISKRKFRKIPDSFTKPKMEKLSKKETRVVPKKKKLPEDRTSKEFREKRIKIITGEKEK